MAGDATGATTASLEPLRKALHQLMSCGDTEQLFPLAEVACDELQRFQEQPRLLDPCLEEVVQPLLPWLLRGDPGDSVSCRAAALVL